MADLVALTLTLSLSLSLSLTRYAPLMGDFVAELGAQVNGPGQVLRW
jgi:hypothetical protein